MESTDNATSKVPCPEGMPSPDHPAHCHPQLPSLQPGYWEYYPILIVYLAATVASLLSNGIIEVAYVKLKSYRQTGPNLYVFLLATAYSVQSICKIIGTIGTLAVSQVTHQLCFALNAPRHLAMDFVLVVILVQGFDRAYAVARPLSYRRMTVKMRLAVIVLLYTFLASAIVEVSVEMLFNSEVIDTSCAVEFGLAIFQHASIMKVPIPPPLLMFALIFIVHCALFVLVMRMKVENESPENKHVTISVLVFFVSLVLTYGVMEVVALLARTVTKGNPRAESITFMLGQTAITLHGATLTAVYYWRSKDHRKAYRAVMGLKDHGGYGSMVQSTSHRHSTVAMTAFTSVAK